MDNTDFYQNSLLGESSPLSSLPTELLVEIIRLIVLDSQSSPPTTNHQLRPEEILSQVCRQLRQIVLDLPDAWANIDFPLFWRPEMLLEYVPVKLARAKDTALRIFVRDGSRAQLPPEILRAFRSVFAAVSNIECITFHLVHAGTCTAPNQLTSELSCPPRSLLIFTKGGLGTRSRISRTYLSGHPNLVALDSINLINMGAEIRIPPECRFRCRSFTLQRSYYQSEGYNATTNLGIPSDLIFLKCPRLERLVIEGHLFNPLPFLVHTDLPPPLKELYLLYFDSLNYFYELYPNTTLPHLTKFGTGVFGVDQLCQFLLSHPTIIDLDLSQATDPLTRDDFGRISKACTQVTRLVVHSWAMGVLVPSRKADELGHRLLEIHRQREFLFTSLVHLSIHATYGAFSINAFDNLIQRRLLTFTGRKGGAKSSGFNRLSTLSISTYLPERSTPKAIRGFPPAHRDSQYFESHEVEWQRRLIPTLPNSMPGSYQSWKEIVTCSARY